MNIHQDLISLSVSILEKHKYNKSNFKEFRNKIIKKPLLPFPFLEIFPKANYAQSIDTANHIIVNGWRMANSPIIKLDAPISWNIEPKSVEVHLHSWLPIQRILAAFDFNKSWSYFQTALNIAEDWINSCPIQLTNQSFEKSLILALNSYKNGSWWYDMAIAQRLTNLTYIFDICCRTSEISDEKIFPIIDHIIFHHILLISNKIFKKHTNHGFFQALHQYVAIQRIPELDDDSCFIKTMAHNRLEEMIKQQYTDDMIHREHSPGYHYMVTVSLMNAYKSGILEDNMNLKELISKAQQVLGYMITPLGNLATFGDTDLRNLFTKEDASFFDDSSLTDMMLGGKQPIGVKSFFNYGYAFIRLYGEHADKDKPWQLSYLAQISAFHSRVHKHADHLSFIWSDKGRDILIDPARYAYNGRTTKGSKLFKEGFWYSDPKRIYCESTMSHNTVGIDDKNFCRITEKPFGSALVYAIEKDNMAITYSKAKYFQSIHHHRQLIMSPGHFLLVLDWLKDFSNKEHVYKQHFHFASEWNIEKQGTQIIGHHAGTDKEGEQDIRIVSLIPEASIGEVVRGQENPELLGWFSDAVFSLKPTSCFNVCQSSNKPVSFATLFVFGKKLEIDWTKTRFNDSLSKGRVVWTDDTGSQVINICRNANVK